MTFERLRPADWVAFLAAFALLFVMAMDWWSTPYGNQARQLQHQLSGRAANGAGSQELARDRARQVAQAAEKNAWQEDAGTIDRVILLALLATVFLAVGAGYLRAAGRRFEPPWTPSGLAAIAATVSAALVAYRIVQEPGADQASTVQAGAPIAVGVLAVLALAAATAMRSEEAGTAFREVPSKEEPKPGDEVERPA
jgi:peptidoglycan/LPS O-acetylase OafA/YrhL